jgi:putative SOS response-associated peptidase YedK
MFADIWDYSDVKGEAVPSFAILTDEPNELVAPYHDRMPVAVRTVNKVSEKNIDAIERAA